MQRPSRTAFAGAAISLAVGCSSPIHPSINAICGGIDVDDNCRPRDGTVWENVTRVVKDPLVLSEAQMTTPSELGGVATTAAVVDIANYYLLKATGPAALNPCVQTTGGAPVTGDPLVAKFIQPVAATTSKGGYERVVKEALRSSVKAQMSPASFLRVSASLDEQMDSEIKKAGHGEFQFVEITFHRSVWGRHGVLDNTNGDALTGFKGCLGDFVVLGVAG